ncbi:MAG: elongation factor G [Candidatus Latescibacterota bacterium]|nr:MAG: elongation factor G [Candidatus Latescibacterota bacterium]
MKEYRSDQIRNLCLVGHNSTGKTSLAEAMLFSAGETNRIGKVEEGSTVSDYRPEEVERKISIASSLLHCDWRGRKLNIIDTPGYADFIGEVAGALRVADSALIVVDSVSGVDVGTEKVWEYTTRYQTPCLFFVNSMTKERANFSQVCQAVKERFSRQALPLQMPAEQGEGFSRIVDLVEMKLLQYENGKASKTDIPAELESGVGELREKLVEAAAEADDQLLEKYLEEGELSPQEILKGLKKGVLERKLFPILCGDSLSNIGTDALMDAIVGLAPSPAEMPPPRGTIPGSGKEVELNCTGEASLAALVFKTVSEPHMGESCFFRVYSGSLNSGDEVLNTTRDATEKIGQIYLLNGKIRKEIGNISAGDIGALVKLRQTHTGDTLSDRRTPVLLPGIEFPEPVIRMAVEPKSRADEDKISTGLARLHDEDPTFLFKVDNELKQTIISGQGELHLEVIVQKLKANFGVDVELTEPKIPYRETIQTAAEGHHRHKKQTGGHGQYGEVFIKLEPKSRGEGFEFVDAIVGGAIPSKFIPAVEKGIREAMQEGVLAGYPVIDLKVTLYDGTFHPVDSSDLSFKIAGSMALKKAVLAARPILLEPIYEVEVKVPQDYMGDVMGDLSARRGRILGMEQSGNFQVIKALVPLAELYRYSTVLRSMTQGRGLHSRKFSHYEEVPREISEKIVAAAKEAQNG